MFCTTVSRSVTLASLVALAACAEQGTTTSTAVALEGEPGKLVIKVWDDADFSGGYEGPGGVVKFSAHAEPTKITATAFVNETQIDLYATSDDDGHVGFRVYGGKLDEDAHALLTGIHVALADQFPYPEEGDSIDKTPPHTQLLRNYLGFLSEAPMRIRDDVNDTRIGRERPEPWEPNPGTKPSPTPPPTTTACSDVPDDDGVTLLPACCGGGTSVAFQHDDLPGGHCFMTSSGSCGSNSPDGCAGRCGPGCLAVPGYYQDCLDHDLCLVHDNGGSGLLPEGCGDEWWEGANDFAYAYATYSSLIWWWFPMPGVCS